MVFLWFSHGFPMKISQPQTTQPFRPIPEFRLAIGLPCRIDHCTTTCHTDALGARVLKLAVTDMKWAVNCARKSGFIETNSKSMNSVGGQTGQRLELWSITSLKAELKTLQNIGIPIPQHGSLTQKKGGVDFSASCEFEEQHIGTYIACSRIMNLGCRIICCWFGRFTTSSTSPPNKRIWHQPNAITSIWIGFYFSHPCFRQILGVFGPACLGRVVVHLEHGNRHAGHVVRIELRGDGRPESALGVWAAKNRCLTAPAVASLPFQWPGNGAGALGSGMKSLLKWLVLACLSRIQDHTPIQFLSINHLQRGEVGHEVRSPWYSAGLDTKCR